MTMVDWLLWLAVAVNICCTIWNVVCARRFNRLMDETAAERSELLVQVNNALAMPRNVIELQNPPAVWNLGRASYASKNSPF